MTRADLVELLNREGETAGWAIVWPDWTVTARTPTVLAGQPAQFVSLIELREACPWATLRFGGAAP